MASKEDSTTSISPALAARGTGVQAPAVDALYTQIAVSFLSPDAFGLESSLGLPVQMLQEATGTDAAFVALLNEADQSIDTVVAAHSAFTRCRPEVLSGKSLTDWPVLSERLHDLRVIEISDTERPAGNMQLAARDLAEIHVGSCLLVGISCERAETAADRPQLTAILGLINEATTEQWPTDLNLLMKLLAANLGAGLARCKVETELTDLHERDGLLLTTANDGIWDFDGQTKKIRFSRRWKEMLGYDVDDDDIAPDWYRLVHPEDMSAVQSKMRDHLEGRSPFFSSMHRMRHCNGEWHWVTSKAKGIMDARGRLQRLIGVEVDINERKLYEEALFREKESAQITLQSIGDGVITTDENNVVEYINPVAEELTGWKVDDATGRPLDEIFRAFHEETCEPLENPLAVAVRRSRSVKSNRPTLLIRRDGNELYIESTASPIRDGNSVITGGVLVFHDVSEARELNRRLSYHASHDVLTGLVNRREFEKRIERALKSKETRDTSHVVCYLDLDQFKIINDTCGHSAGDALLSQLGALLKSKIRWRDTLARLGGDEFGVLLESCTLEEAMTTADTLREAVGEFKFIWDERSFRLTVSVGVVPLTATEAEDVAGVLSAADSACAAAKDAGRNRVHSYHENDIDMMRRRREMQWAARINNALEENRFELFRQTILPLQEQDSGAHYELLLRMRDENGALVSPELFISAAERYGITPNIDRWVIRNALRWLVSEADERARLSMCSINLSGQSLGDEKFLPFVIEQFQTSGIAPDKVCFEITETAAIASYSQANRFINALKELGCKFALDDFGTGLSSFGYLKHFPVDFLKIDGSFVKEILHDPIDREMVRSINEIGHLTGKKTIAEFAENSEIITMLRGMGIDYAQGYGVSEPQKVLQAIA
ncbi:MAG: EAL domain-containing protein [Pseudomonadota bacterium]